MVFDQIGGFVFALSTGKRSAILLWGADAATGPPLGGPALLLVVTARGELEAGTARPEGQNRSKPFACQ